MKRSSLSFYERFARLRWPRSYRGKFLLVAFVGTHIPLIAVVAYVLFAADAFPAWPLLGVLLGATVVGVVLTFAALHYLLQPIPYTAHALTRFVEERTLPDLPTGYDDAAGRLMRDTQAALTRLDALGRFRDRFLGMVVHDLRSPATSTLLATEALGPLLAETPQREDGEELLGMIRRATRQQLAFSRMLLDQMHRDTLRLDVEPQAVRAATLAERAADENRLLAERQGVALQIETDEGDGTLHTDPRLAGQVLQNIVGNAVAFSPEGGTVTLRTAHAGEHIAFTIYDEGRGMSEEEQETLFEPFETGAARRERQDDPLTPADGDTLPAGGFGLGLWIAQTFAELLGGSVAVDSTPGEGSAFKVRLPRDLPQDAAPQAASSSSAATAESPRASARR